MASGPQPAGRMLVTFRGAVSVPAGTDVYDVEGELRSVIRDHLDDSETWKLETLDLEEGDEDQD